MQKFQIKIRVKAKVKVDQGRKAIKTQKKTKAINERIHIRQASNMDSFIFYNYFY